jgi:hypothetical protein
MRIRTVMTAVALVAALTASGAALNGQGQGQGQGKGQGTVSTASGAPAQPAVKGQAKEAGPAAGRAARAQEARQAAAAQGKGQGKGRSAAAAKGPPGQAARGVPGAAPQGAGAVRGHAFTRTITVNEVPPAARQFASNNRRPHVIAAGALTRAHMRGLDNELRIVPAGERITLTNRRGNVLVMLDDQRARDLGWWDVRLAEHRVDAGAPSFCRSGAGHPVWGRQWCLHKGFGLGEFQDVRWGRTPTVGDIIFGRTLQSGRVGTDALVSLLGTTAFNRLALHAVTLGYAEPLVGTWVADPAEPPVLLVHSGPAPVAELVDVNRDGRADLMLVALRPW